MKCNAVKGGPDMLDDLSFKCKCGSQRFNADNNPPLATDEITCGDCGRSFGTLADVTSRVLFAKHAELKKLRRQIYAGAPVEPGDEITPQDAELKAG